MKIISVAKILVIFISIFLFSCKNAIKGEAISEKDFDINLLNKTYYMNLNSNYDDLSGKNFSFKSLSFFSKSGHVYYSEAVYYPTSRIRTVSHYGVVEKFSKNGQIILFPLKKTEIIKYGESSNIYAPFNGQGYFDIDAKSKRHYTYFIKIIDGDNIEVQKDKYTNYKKDMLSYIQNNDFERFLRLYQFNILLHQSKMKDFGKLTSGTKARDGFVGGNFDPKIQVSGKMGINTTFNSYEEFPKIKLTGQLFGGTATMGNTVNVHIDGKLRANVNYGNVKVEHGLAAGGYYIVDFFDENGNKTLVKNTSYDILCP